ncbi:hypothetical protein [Parachlamydia acanthamoebae]|uniref:Uncharacterized protein n=2 Tax=Parachlamydia acanthamoebae TaxID=83552 RepID=F8KUX3_PARAV|nr:hypothetical protein [Parachlamydia acanthamoebae]KIA76503.1 hypothetical protein DB43_AF00090 [Parachlamydia acanthamoebae]CCB85038.1 putative uncharacterized protein [Parachlamydia acanthamoebae UV-7]
MSLNLFNLSARSQAAQQHFREMSVQEIDKKMYGVGARVKVGAVFALIILSGGLLMVPIGMRLYHDRKICFDSQNKAYKLHQFVKDVTQLEMIRYTIIWY